MPRFGFRRPTTLIRLALLLPMAIPANSLLSQGTEGLFKNLKVLPKDITREELGEIMLANIRGLGLRRLEGRGCLYCHVGSLDVPRSEWDYASDEKPTKRKARTMMRMVQAINGEYLTELEDRIAPDLKVSCATCHAGRTDPRPLPSVLLAAYRAGGLDSLTRRYQSLRNRYFGSDAYDFRAGVLAGVALFLADTGAIDNGIAVAALDADANPDSPAARQIWVQLRLERTVNAEGAPAALEELDRLRPTFDPGVYSPSLLDGLGWRLRRSNRAEAGNALIMSNRERFPEEYIPNESVAFVLHDGGQREEAYRILEAWLDEHPDHDRARRLLTNLRDRR